MPTFVFGSMKQVWSRLPFRDSRWCLCSVEKRDSRDFLQTCPSVFRHPDALVKQRCAADAQVALANPFKVRVPCNQFAQFARDGQDFVDAAAPAEAGSVAA